MIRVATPLVLVLLYLTSIQAWAQGVPKLTSDSTWVFVGRDRENNGWYIDSNVTSEGGNVKCWVKVNLSGASKRTSPGVRGETKSLFEFTPDKQSRMVSSLALVGAQLTVEELDPKEKFAPIVDGSPLDAIWKILYRKGVR